MFNAVVQFLPFWKKQNNFEKIKQRNDVQVKLIKILQNENVITFCSANLRLLRMMKIRILPIKLKFFSDLSVED